MFNLFKRFVKKDCEIIVEGKDLLTVLRSIDKHNLGIIDFSIENCGVSDRDDWRLIFRTTEHKFDEFFDEIKANGVDKIRVPVKDIFGNLSFKEL